MSEATLTPTGGGSMRDYIIRLKRGAKATTEDALTLALRGVSMILALTEQGKDYTGKPFAPYSTKGPVYVYPNSAGKAGSKRQAAAQRFAKKLGAENSFSRSRIGLKFDSYADYKRSLGRSTVDLSGPKNRMLRAIKVRCNGTELEQRAKPGFNQTPATEFTIGIWDEALAVIGAAHNSGAKTGRGHKVTLPKRRFLDLSRASMLELERMLVAMQTGRLDDLL